MLRKDTKKGDIVYHKTHGKAEFIRWSHAIINVNGSELMLPIGELSNKPRKIPGIKPGWYSLGVDGHLAHFMVQNDAAGSYRSACGKVKAFGEALIAEIPPRCKRCEISARDAVKTTLFDFQKGK